MKKAVGISLAFIMALTVFALPDISSAATKAPGKVAVSTIKVTVANGNSLKLAWGTAKTGKKVLKTTCYQVEYKVEFKQDNGKYKVSTNWKALKKGKTRYHIYKGTKGNTYRVSIRVRAYNGKKFGSWSATRAKAKKIVKTIPAFVPKYATFDPTLNQVSGNRSVTVPDYLNTQGCAFDTYTQEDGYNFTIDSTPSGDESIELVHFKMDADSNIEQMGSLHYSKDNLGHANDATIYQQDNRKLLFVAITGGTVKSTKDSNGNTIKLAFIDLAEYAAQEAGANQIGGEDPAANDDPDVNENPTAAEGPDVNEEPAADVPRTTNVYGVAINTNGVKMSNTLANSAFSGITYVGKKTISGTARQVFVLKDGRTFYAAYLTMPNGNPKLTFFDSARINKPVIKYNGTTYAATTQGVTYHNGYLYLSYSGEPNKMVLCNMLLGRISYADLFRDAYGDLRNLQIRSKRITTRDGEALAKHIPEALFFRTLNGAEHLYLSVNRGTTADTGSDIDAVLRSNETY